MLRVLHGPRTKQVGGNSSGRAHLEGQGGCAQNDLRNLVGAVPGVQGQGERRADSPFIADDGHVPGKHWAVGVRCNRPWLNSPVSCLVHTAPASLR